MSLGKRQFSGSKLKFDAALYQSGPEQLTKKRPGSGQPISTIKSPLPPRKPVYSGRQRNLVQAQEAMHVQQEVMKTSINRQQQQLTPSITQSQLPFVRSPLKTSKPPLQQDRKIILHKQETTSAIQLKSTSIPRQTLTGGDRPLTKKTEHQGQLTSPGQMEKNFTWNNQIELVVTSSDFENKRRQISHEKLKQLPKQLQQVKKPIQQQSQTQGHKKIIFNPKQMNITQSVPQQPKCFSDFTMTSGRNDLQQIFASMQAQLKEATLTSQNPVLNMSEIQEQSDDACSSLAQSYQFQK